MLCVRDMDVKEHHLSQVGVLTAYGGTSYFRAFHPSPTFPLHPVTFYLWSYHLLEREEEGINRWLQPLREERALPPAEDFALGCPLATGQARRKLFRRGASQWFVSLVVNRHTSKVSPGPWESRVWPQNTEQRHKEETGSVTFP